MMKSPTSLIRFRNAVGVMLALSALFAVVISAVTITQDQALGQTDIDCDHRLWSKPQSTFEEDDNTVAGYCSQLATCTASGADVPTNPGQAIALNDVTALASTATRQ